MSTLARKKGVGAVIWDYLTTVDHKKIAILYLIAGGFFFLLGGLEAMIIRIQLAVPNNDFISAGFYNEVLTMHGTTMIFLAAMPLVFAMMNAVVPIQIGARDVAFPFLNALGFWLFFFGGVFLNLSWFLGGAPDAGWTSYASLSLASPTHGIDFYVLGLQISGLGTLIGGINFLVTIINMRAPGMTYMRMPMFTWATFVTSALILFAFPPLTVGLIFMMMTVCSVETSLIQRLVEIRSFGSTCSGFSVTQKYTFSYCQRSVFSLKFLRRFHVNVCSVIHRWCLQRC